VDKGVYAWQMVCQDLAWTPDSGDCVEAEPRSKLHLQYSAAMPSRLEKDKRSSSIVNGVSFHYQLLYIICTYRCLYIYPLRLDLGMTRDAQVLQNFCGPTVQYGRIVGSVNSDEIKRVLCGQFLTNESSPGQHEHRDSN